VHDVAIIGAGAVGCAMARRFCLEGARVLLIEKAPDILAGASKANSAILHTGFDAPPGSVELACIRAGYAEYLSIHGTMGLPLVETGAVVVAWSEADLVKLDGIVDQAHENGIVDVVRLSRAELAAREPHLSDRALGAVLVPGESIVDPWTPFLAYVLQALGHGATVLRGTEVTGGSFDGESWALETSQGSHRARSVINCAGLFGDLLDKTLLGSCDFEVRPRKGQFVVLDKLASRHVRSIVLPVPNERTKGVVITRTVFGNVLVGPTAEDQQDRSRAAVDRQTLQALLGQAAAMIPGLDGIGVTALYAGLRPASDRKEYRISARPPLRWITVGGIRSTGLTAALGIARHVFDLWRGFAMPVGAPADVLLPKVPCLAEGGARDWLDPGYGEVVCHCEMVTRREIEAALSGPLPAGDFAGLKRRTRCGMGRCQGFNCNARIAQICDGRLSVPMTADNR